MNKLIAIIIAVGLAIMSGAHAAPNEAGACNSSCATEQDQCISRLGSASEGNCSDGFRICVQRCNPQRQNASFIESEQDRRLYSKLIQASNMEHHCTSQCALSGRSCVEAGNQTSQCREAQNQCKVRCKGSNS